MKTTLLIDGDVLVYQIGCAVEKPIHWGDDFWTLHADAGEAKAKLDDNIASWKSLLKADEVRVALSCKTEEGFRRAICPSYKSNRKNTRKPVVHGALREHMLTAYGAIFREGLEADDILGVLATEPHEGERIIVSIDKDFKGVPCNFYNFRKVEDGIVNTTAPQATYFHALQTLMGDATDGYQGIPGVGPKSAEKILKDVPQADYWKAIVQAYKDAGLNEACALLTARLARILQHTDYDRDTGLVKLWTPSQPSKRLTKTRTKKSASSSAVTTSP